MRERRKHIRRALRAQVKLMHPVAGDCEVEMRDLSDGGGFVFTANRDDYPVGGVVKIQSLDIEDAPVLSVMRHEADGIGLMFIED